LTRRRDPDPLVAATAYRFTCEVKVSDGSIWFRLADTGYWAPRDGLLTEQGTTPPKLPTC
jgi:hypothetical protein